MGKGQEGGEDGKRGRGLRCGGGREALWTSEYFWLIQRRRVVCCSEGGGNSLRGREYVALLDEWERGAGAVGGGVML